MATKKKADKEKVLIAKAVKATINTNTVLPILEDVYLDGERLIATDLETSVVIPFKSGINACVPAKLFLDVLDMMETPKFSCDKNWGVEMSESGKSRKVKLMGEDPGNFPVTYVIDKDYPSIGALSESDLGLMKTALSFVSNNDLRPAMTGVLIGKRIVATDAHRLYWHKLSKPVTQEFILPSKSAKILLLLGGEWVLSIDGEHENYVCFSREDGVKVVTRAIDARYPDYKVVIPKDKPWVTLTINPDLFMQELKNAAKFANRSTCQVTLGLNGMFSIQSQDVDFSFEYENKFENKNGLVDFEISPEKPKEYTLNDKPVRILKDHGSIVEIPGDNYSDSDPVQVMKSDLKEVPPSLYIAFNAKFLMEVISKIDGPITMDMWSPTKCAIINKDFLVMPLMMNQ